MHLENSRITRTYVSVSPDREEIQIICLDPEEENPREDKNPEVSQSLSEINWQIPGVSIY